MDTWSTSKNLKNTWNQISDNFGNVVNVSLSTNTMEYGTQRLYIKYTRNKQQFPTINTHTMIQSHSTSITYYQHLIPTTRTTVALMTMMWTTMSGLTIRWIGFQDHTRRVHGCLVPCAIGRNTQKVSDQNFFKRWGTSSVRDWVRMAKDASNPWKYDYYPRGRVWTLSWSYER